MPNPPEFLKIITPFIKTCPHPGLRPIEPVHTKNNFSVPAAMKQHSLYQLITNKLRVFNKIFSFQQSGRDIHTLFDLKASCPFFGFLIKKDQ